MTISELIICDSDEHQTLNYVYYNLESFRI